MKVDVAVLGFFVHVIDERTGNAHACAMDVPGWPHEYHVLMSTASLRNHRNLENVVSVEGFPGYGAVLLNDIDMRLEGTPSEAGLTFKRGTGMPTVGDPDSCHALDLIVDFSELLVGAKLDAAWEKTPEIRGRFTFTGGEVSADPDAFTSSARVWKWTGKGNRAHQQAISSFLRYRSPDMDEATLVITPRNDANASEERIPLVPDVTGGSSQILLVSRPADPPDATDVRSKFRLSLAHAHAAMLLAEVPRGDIRWVAAPVLDTSGGTAQKCAGGGRFNMFVSGETGCSAGRWHTD